MARTVTITEEQLIHAKALREQGLTWDQITETINVTKGILQYHLIPGRKEKHRILALAKYHVKKKRK